MTTKPTIPKGMGSAGRALWRRLTDAYSFDAGELALLATACKQADDIAKLESLLAEQGMVVTGSKGQPRLTPVVAELRQSRLALARLVAELRLPDASDRPMSPSSRQASKAATARWKRTAQLRGARRGEAS